MTYLTVMLKVNWYNPPLLEKKVLAAQLNDYGVGQSQRNIMMFTKNRIHNRGAGRKLC